ncbi:nicotinamide-nucleotide amidase [Parabacteroides sp. PF5-5]|uniref:competence/damage-inducible protein A n=1 Tax=unclassified Parabacteroides TaxID=2649774 RepID=UPI00247523DA|nr:MULTISPECIES: competence/damage-inducible protein A [unclassified Parabacteroides]MDH6304327.1 nicotinamide-nucleotide amidase [Parabacteroides sp. PH5-39]MDH6315520.1 nicotinamide-nucleotide amidase [Parabacteroides sp. PF5-13]MDH6318986.1 nicotinamide-nucleotide amidase [Parabacteroides sp. PH5-13]MDH6322715.1 nicotinamide-nucleotide amidase [Parabacteroides sp. PH5-8]MDH6326713.1 nicotinamide-nucleotide amidase [Parabacteroides sp. PH5-41]
MNVQIITIGDELLIGQVVDTNSAWMGQELNKEGFQVIWRTAVGDVEKDMLEVIDAAMNRVQIVLITGGIGPTKDDITKKTLCKYFDSGLHFSEEVYQNIEQLFNKTGRVINELTRDQALVPDKCTVIQNKAGTAPCSWFERDGKILVSMPGVPYEMKWLMTNEIIPRLKKRFHQDVFIRHQTTWVSGYSESGLAIELTQFEEELPTFIKLAYLPQPGLIRLRLSVYAESKEQAELSIKEQNEKLHKLLNGHILAEEDTPLEELIGKALLEKQLTMGTAESCTGGRIASMLTSIPGSSRYFVGSIVSYSNEVKHNVLGVSNEDLEKYGAVSQPVVEQMALGAIRVLGCDCAVATSGIAGPDGGTPEKPVGTVWIAAAYKNKVVSECYHFTNIREMNIARTANTALLKLLLTING